MHATFTPEVCGSQDLESAQTADFDQRSATASAMLYWDAMSGNFNWQGRVRVKDKDIGSGLGLVSGLLAHLAKILQIFRNFNYAN